MSEPRRVLLVGGSGLIGQGVMRAAMGRADLRLLALSRQEHALPKGARMELLVAPTTRWDEAIATLAPDAVICALGTTWRQAGRDETAFRAVDHDLALKVASDAKTAGATSFVLVSSVGADIAARAFYLRVKGETERDIGKLGFKRFDALRPGLLRGARGGDRRFGERLGIVASPVTDLLLHGSKRKFRSIDAALVSAAALQCAMEKAAGRFVHDNDSIKRAARRLAGAA